MTKIAFVFPGQGTQYIKMGKKLTEENKTAALIFEEANDTLHFSLSDMVFNGTMEELTHSANAQPAVITASYAFYRVVCEKYNIVPAMGAGHSLGEITALIAAGGMSFSDGVRFARKRGFIMQESYEQKKGNCALLLNLDICQVHELINEIKEKTGYLAISSYNASHQFLVSGTADAIKAVGTKTVQAGGQFIPYRMVAMKVDMPVHCDLMNFLEKRLKSLLSRFEFKPLKWDVISNMDARPYVSESSITNNLSLQLTRPVQWIRTIEYMKDQGVTHIFETGPLNVLSELIREQTNQIDVFCYDLLSDMKRFSAMFRAAN